MTKVFISSVCAEDERSVLELCDKNFGKGYINRKSLWSTRGKVAITDYWNEVVGYGSYSIINKNLAILNQCVVEEKYRGQKIAFRLVASRLNDISIIGIKNVIAFCWIYPDGTIPMDGILSRFDFKKVRVIENRYRGKNCKYCGKDCTCKAQLYMKRM